MAHLRRIHPSRELSFEETNEDVEQVPPTR
jgi:hypothetical protein